MICQKFRRRRCINIAQHDHEIRYLKACMQGGQNKLNWTKPVFELPGGWGLNLPTVSSTPPNTMSNHVLEVSYRLNTYDLHHNFGRSSTVEKFNPELIFHNSNTKLN